MTGEEYAYTAFLGSFILLYSDDYPKPDDVNHELIHFWQSLYLLWVGMWVLYSFYFFKNLIKYKNVDKAYMAIPFEKEAYQNEDDLEYTLYRKPYAWTKYL